jgi:hypothetical protein
MLRFIISIESILGGLSVHILRVDMISIPETIVVPIITSPAKLKHIRMLLEKNKLAELAIWFKNEYSLPHSKITITFGPELKGWLNDNRNNFYNNKEE